MTADLETATSMRPRRRLSASQPPGVCCRARFGIEGECSELPSERDRNVYVQTGPRAFVLKVSNSAEDPAVIDDGGRGDGAHRP